MRCSSTGRLLGIVFSMCVGTEFIEQTKCLEAANSLPSSTRETEFSLSELIVYYWQKLALIQDPHRAS